MNSPVISVIIGTFNRSRDQLKAAVESIISQTITDWEMILYDDGSDLEYSGEAF